MADDGPHLEPEADETRQPDSGAARRRPVLMPLDELFPAEVAVSTLDEASVPPPLFPGEFEAVARAVAGRREEFARGRACARAAIARLGLPACPILVNESRAPIWPDGVVGSITHCRGLVAAAACRRGRILGLGLDAERLEPVETEVARLIWSAEERRRAVETLGLEERIAAKLVFSAKETVHKCIEPLTGETLDFLDVEIVLDPDTSAFTVVPVSTRSSMLSELSWIAGCFRISRTHIVTTGVVRRSVGPGPGVHSDPPGRGLTHPCSR